MPIQPFLLAGLVLAADRLAKAFVSRRLCVGDSVTVGPALRVCHVVSRIENKVVFSGVLGAVAVGVIVVATRFGSFFARPIAQLGLAAAVAGAASNYYDAWRCGAVIDFLDLRWGPVFNFADVAITAGAITALWFM